MFGLERDGLVDLVSFLFPQVFILSVHFFLTLGLFDHSLVIVLQLADFVLPFFVFFFVLVLESLILGFQELDFFFQLFDGLLFFIVFSFVDLELGLKVFDFQLKVMFEAEILHLVIS